MSHTKFSKKTGKPCRYKLMVFFFEQREAYKNLGEFEDARIPFYADRLEDDLTKAFSYLQKKLHDIATGKKPAKPYNDVVYRDGRKHRGNCQFKKGIIFDNYEGTKLLELSWQEVTEMKEAKKKAKAKYPDNPNEYNFKRLSPEAYQAACKYYRLAGWSFKLIGVDHRMVWKRNIGK